MFFDVFVFEVGFMLKIEDNLYLLALNRKTRHYQRENSFILIHRLYVKKLRKTKTGNLQKSKNE